MFKWFPSLRSSICSCGEHLLEKLAVLAPSQQGTFAEAYSWRHLKTPKKTSSHSQTQVARSWKVKIVQ